MHESEIENEEIDEELKQILLIATLSNMSNVYRKAAELLVDDLLANKEEKKNKVSSFITLFIKKNGKIIVVKQAVYKNSWMGDIKPKTT